MNSTLKPVTTASPDSPYQHDRHRSSGSETSQHPGAATVNCQLSWIKSDGNGASRSVLAFCGLFGKSTGHVGRGNPGHGLPSRAGVLNF